MPTTPSPYGDAGRAETLDLRGEVCPYTFVYTRLRLEELPIGARLHVLVDHEPAVRNVPRSVREWGQEVESVAERGDGTWRIAVCKRVD
ncbi:MAG: sulfurtransferase TusA family protein [Proteobacteria bacterium]|nr:sulfurtransferase TusA family protein [Pseudomonadota bacterium]